MSRILIETYRTWDIWFDTYTEKFIAEDGVNESEKGKSSLTAARKFVDDFRKANAEFKPFDIVNIGYGDKTPLKVIGIRKDGRYITENAKGEKGQLSEYNENDWALPNPDNNDALARIEQLKAQKRELDAKITAEEKTLAWTTVRGFKLTQDYGDFIA